MKVYLYSTVFSRAVTFPHWRELYSYSIFKRYSYTVFFNC